MGVSTPTNASPDVMAANIKMIKNAELSYIDVIGTPNKNSSTMSWNLAGTIPNSSELVLWKTLFPYMISDLDMANWDTSMLRTGVGYDWTYDRTSSILTINSRHPECVSVQYGTAVKQRIVRVYYIPQD